MLINARSPPEHRGSLVFLLRPAGLSRQGVIFLPERSGFLKGPVDARNVFSRHSIRIVSSSQTPPVPGERPLCCTSNRGIAFAAWPLVFCYYSARKEGCQYVLRKTKKGQRGFFTKQSPRPIAYTAGGAKQFRTSIVHYSSTKWLHSSLFIQNPLVFNE